jgi:hypothetical protein
MRVLAAHAFQIEDSDSWMVEAIIGGGRSLYHNGPAPFPLFTKEQAERLATRVNAACEIDPQHWNDGSWGIDLETRLAHYAEDEARGWL